jgi:hypothetical protein
MSDKLKNIIVTIIFLMAIIVVFIVNLIKEDTLISTSERRKLTAFPSFSINSLIKGTFTEQFEKYAMDQFIKRDEFRTLKTFMDLKVFRKKDVNGVYQYKGIIVKQEYPLNENYVLNVAEKINIIKEKYLDETNNIYYSIIPDKNYYVEDKYLKMDYSKIEKIMQENLEGIEYINIFDCLQLEDYYYTDPHWKQENLKNVFQKIANQMDFLNRIKTDFEEQEITKFQGSYSGQLPVKTSEDTIKILTNEIIKNSKSYNFETNEETSIYNLDKIKSSDKYDIYLSGATPLLTIENQNSSIDKELIVFRDSFASSLVPLFTEAYKKITLIDTRYIKTDYLKDLVEFDNKDVLFIYSTLVINNSSTLK